MSGVAGYKAQLKIGGSPVLVTDGLTEMLPNLENYFQIFRILDATQRIISANHPVTVKNAYGIEIPSTEYRLNYLEGIILFNDDKIGDSEFDTITVDYRYVPLEYIGGSKEYSVEIGGDVLDSTAFHDSTDLSAGYREKTYGIHDVSVSFSRWQNFSNQLLSAKENKIPVFVSINPGASKTLIKGWFHIETDNMSGDVGGLEDEALSLVLTDNNGKTSFSYSYNWSSGETADISFSDLVLNWFCIVE